MLVRVLILVAHSYAHEGWRIEHFNKDQIADVPEPSADSMIAQKLARLHVEAPKPAHKPTETKVVPVPEKKAEKDAPAENAPASSESQDDTVPPKDGIVPTPAAPVVPAAPAATAPKGTNKKK